MVPLGNSPDLTCTAGCICCNQHEHPQLVGNVVEWKKSMREVADMRRWQASSVKKRDQQSRVCGNRDAAIADVLLFDVGLYKHRITHSMHICVPTLPLPNAQALLASAHHLIEVAPDDHVIST